MKKYRVLFALVFLIGIGVVASNTRVTYAVPRTVGYEIAWYTIDGGGAQDLAGGSYSLSGTVGQSDAGSQSGGSYMLNGGFWVDFLGIKIMLPLIMR